MNALGTQLLLELHGCDSSHLDDLSYIRDTMRSAAQAVGVTILGETFHKFSPQGVTGILAIAESHFSIHTWPEYGYAAADIFTCGDSFDPAKAAELIIQRLGSRDPTVHRVERGSLPAYLEASGGQ